MSTKNDYQPILDWSHEGRRRLAEEHKWEIHLLLDESFTELIDQRDIGLAAFGFRGEDPVAEAVTFAYERFRDGDLDEARIHAKHRSFVLFTLPAFWLAQKVGAPAYARLRAQWNARAEPDLGAVPGEVALPEREVAEVLRAVSSTLGRLRASTCAALVGWWLEGSAKLLEALTGRTPASDRPREGSAKSRSFWIADAVFRFGVLHEELLKPPGAFLVTRSSLFTQCANESPFRVPDDVVAESLDLNRRGVQQQRRTELVQLAGLLTELAALDDTPPLRRVLCRNAIRKSLLHLYKLDDPQLRLKISRLGGLLEMV